MAVRTRPTGLAALKTKREREKNIVLVIRHFSVVYSLQTSQYVQHICEVYDERSKGGKVVHDKDGRIAQISIFVPQHL